MTDPRALARAAVATGTILTIVAGGCSNATLNTSPSEDASTPGSGTTDASPNDTDPGTSAMPNTFDVQLVADGGAGMQRVNFAIPLAPGVITDPGQVAVYADTTELPAAHRALARYGNGSVRSVQLQVDVDVDVHHVLHVVLGTVGATGPELAPVTATLAGSGNTIHPQVWAILPSSVWSASAVAGTVMPRAANDAWSSICDYNQWNTDKFLAGSASRDVWLYDRITAMYRGHAITGDLAPLRSAYREAAIYLGGMTIANGVATGIAVPDAATDLKYYYAQGVALHYLLTGDDRYREAAEAVSAKIATMWNPHYDGADRFWTERHAGFALLAHEWAAMVTDDQAAAITARAETAATAFLDVQATEPVGYADPDARCFAHSATAHGEDFGYFGCSAWMSAILAEALDTHAKRVGGARAEAVKQSLARLGRAIARDGRDTDGRPYYWMGEGNGNHEVDDFDEHWGESAYIMALAWNATGRTEPTLRQAADELITGLRTYGAVGQTRSFNWQCRAAVMTPALLH